MYAITNVREEEIYPVSFVVVASSVPVPVHAVVYTTPVHVDKSPPASASRPVTSAAVPYCWTQAHAEDTLLPQHDHFAHTDPRVHLQRQDIGNKTVVVAINLTDYKDN